MKNKNMAYCWDSLEGMSTAQLEDLLQEELRRTPPDGDKVRLILSVLVERDKEADAESGSEIERAWEKYQKQSLRTAVTPVKRCGWLLRVASVVLIVGVLVLAIPQEAQAEGLFDRVARWTDSFFQLLGFGDTDESSEEYVFQTDNPGLQQVYDAVVDLGVLEPVVPTWLPDGFELMRYDVDDGINKKVVSSVFEDRDRMATITIIAYKENGPSKYYKDDLQWSKYESEGTVYNIMQNDDMWVVVWTINNIECFISVDCQENVLYKILESIYSMEGE